MRRGRCFPLWAALRGAAPVDGSRIVGLLSHDTVKVWWDAKWHLCDELLARVIRSRRILCVDADSLIQKIGARYGSDFRRYFGWTHGVGFLFVDSHGRVSYNQCRESRRAATVRDEVLARLQKKKLVSAMSDELRMAYILLIETKGILDGKAWFRRS